MFKKNPVLVVLSFACAVIALSGASSLSARAAAQFDPAFYGAAYPDVVAVFGTDPQALLNHYLAYGMAEGRFPSAAVKPWRASRPRLLQRRPLLPPIPLQLQPQPPRSPLFSPFPSISWPTCPACARA